MARRTQEPTLVVLHKRIEALTKRVEQLDRAVFKAIRIDVENCMPDLESELAVQADEVRQVVVGMLRPVPSAPQAPQAPV